MGLVTGITFERDIPHEPGQKMTFRRLSFVELGKAVEVKKQAVFADLRAMGADMASELQKIQPRRQTMDELIVLAHSPETYDKLTVLKAAIVAWTYPAPVTDNSVSALDQETADWAFGEVMGVINPRDDAGKKSGSGGSTKG